MPEYAGSQAALNSEYVAAFVNSELRRVPTVPDSVVISMLERSAIEPHEVVVAYQEVEGILRGYLDGKLIAAFDPCDRKRVVEFGDIDALYKPTKEGWRYFNERIHDDNKILSAERIQRHPLRTV